MIPVRMLVAGLLLAGALPVLAQDAPPAPCSSPEARRFDFWLGEWDLSWEGGEGRNSITRLFDDCALQEDFQGQMPDGLFRGHSVSQFARGAWRQTWVDDQGGYLEFVGGWENDRMVLYGEGRLPDGTPTKTRMVFKNIEADRLDWDWDRSVDDGASWQTVWTIHYERRR